MKALERKLPPVVFGLLCALACWSLARAFPTLTITVPGARIIAALIFVAGGAVALAGVAVMRQHGTTMDPRHPKKASSVVTTGIYRYTRNPMYLGLLLALLAWTLYLGNVAAMAVLPGFVIYMNRFQIRPEETALADLFGDDYSSYRARVRRWL